jgi:hypothetical protein
MQFDPVEFGRAMGEAICKSIEPLKTRIEALEKQIAELPDPVAGKDGAPGKDGASVTLEDVRPILDDGFKAMMAEVRQQVEAAVKAMPAPKDGRDGRDGNDGADGKDGAPGEKGADGIGIADTIIDRGGNLVVTFMDGRMKNLGPVVGADGRDGADFTEFNIDYDGERKITIKGRGGDITKLVPIPLDRGYWREGMACEKGDILTHDGSAWIALRDTKSKPGIENKEDWRLFARKGRDGERGPKGADGTPAAPVKLKPEGEGAK